MRRAPDWSGVRTVGLVLALALTLPLASAAPGDGTGKRGGGGRDRQGLGACGDELRVVGSNGAEKVYAPAADFLHGFEVVEIDQGEKLRPGIELSKLLGAVGAGWVTADDCKGKSRDIPFGLPVEGAFYVVETGRGTLKIVREVRPGRFVNVAQPVRAMRFHASGVKPKAPPAPTTQ